MVNQRKKESLFFGKKLTRFGQVCVVGVWDLRARGGSGGKYRRLAGRAEGTGHQPSAISRQPGVPPKRRLLWMTALAASSTDRPSPHRAGGRGGIAGG